MANTHINLRGWTDLAPSTRFRNRLPTTIILADEIDDGEWDSFLGDVHNPGMDREVVYKDEDGARWPMTLVLYVHPAGAGALTLTGARGKFLGEDGAFTEDAEEQVDIAGGMLSHYSETSSEIGSTSAGYPVWSTALQEGDAIWLVRNGRYFALCDGVGTVADKSPVVTGNGGGTDGAIEDSVALSAPPVLAELEERWMTAAGRCIGVAREAEGATVALFADMDLHLHRRWRR